MTRRWGVALALGWALAGCHAVIDPDRHLRGNLDEHDAGIDAAAPPPSDAAVDAGSPDGGWTCDDDLDCGPVGLAICDAGVCRGCPASVPPPTTLFYAPTGVIWSASGGQVALAASFDGSLTWLHLGWIGLDPARGSLSAMVSSIPPTDDPNDQVHHDLTVTGGIDHSPRSIALAPLPGDPQRVRVLAVGSGGTPLAGWLATATVATAGGASTLSAIDTRDDLSPRAAIAGQAAIARDESGSEERLVWLEEGPEGPLLHAASPTRSDLVFGGAITTPLVHREPVLAAGTHRVVVPTESKLWVWSAGLDHEASAAAAIEPEGTPGLAHLGGDVYAFAEPRGDRVALRRLTCRDATCTLGDVVSEQRFAGPVSAASLAAVEGGVVLAAAYFRAHEGDGVEVRVLSDALRALPNAHGELAWHVERGSSMSPAAVDVVALQRDGGTFVGVAAWIDRPTAEPTVIFRSLTIAPGCGSP